MVQAEVADRLAAPPGSRTYGVPSVKAAWFADVRRAGAVGRNVFWPAPNVDSGLVAWTRREPPATTAHPRAGLRGRRRRVRPAPQDPARGALAGSPARPRPPRPPCAPPASTRPRAARCSTSRRSPGSPKPWSGRGAAHDRLRHRPRAGQDQPPPRRRRAAGGRLPPAGDRLPGRRALRRRHRRALAGLDARRHRRPTGSTPTPFPSTGDNIVDRAARLLAEHHGVDSRGLGLDRQGDPGRRRHGRRLGRRGRRAGRARPALEARTPPTTTCSRSRPSSAATCRSRWSAVRRSAPAAASWSSRCADPATWWWVVVPSPRGAVDAGGLPALRRARLPTRRRSRPGPAPARSRSRPATPSILAGALHNDLETAALDLRPDLGDLLELGERERRAARPGVRLGSDLPVPRPSDADDARGVAGRLSEQATTSSWSPTARSPARTWSPMPSPGINLLNLERVSKSYGVRPAAHRRLARRRRRRADRRRRPQRRRQDHAARRDDRRRGARRRPGVPAARAAHRLPAPDRRAGRHPHRPRGGARRPVRPRVGRRRRHPRDRRGAAGRGDPRPGRGRAVRRRAAPLLARRPAPRRARPDRPRRADQPPRRRGGRLAGRPPGAGARRRWSSSPTTAGSSTRSASGPGRSTTASSTSTRAATRRTSSPRPSASARAPPPRCAAATWSARSSPGCAAGRRPARRSRSSASTRPTRSSRTCRRPRDRLELQRFATQRLGKDVIDVEDVDLRAWRPGAALARDLAARPGRPGRPRRRQRRRQDLGARRCSPASWRRRPAGCGSVAPSRCST